MNDFLDCVLRGEEFEFTYGNKTFEIVHTGDETLVYFHSDKHHTILYGQYLSKYDLLNHCIIDGHPLIEIANDIK